MLILFYVLIVQQLAQGFYSLWQGVVWLQMCKRRLARATGFYTPRVALFCPVKGMEAGLAENLSALIEQDFALDPPAVLQIRGLGGVVARRLAAPAG